MKRKSPFPNLSWPIYLLFIALGLVLAKVLLDVYLSSYNGTLNVYVYDALLILYGGITCILYYLIGKVIFSKIAGFDIVYFNFIFIGFRKVNGKLKCFWGGKENYSTRVEITPNPNKKQNLSLALWGGSITLIFATLLTLVLIFTLPTSNEIKAFFIFSSIFNFFSFVGYMLPVKLDSFNDGFALFLIKKYKLGDLYLSNKRNLNALYNENEELHYVDNLGDNNDPITMEAKIFNYYYAIRKNDVELIKKACDSISSDTKFVVGEDFSSTALIAQAYLMCLNEQYDLLKDYYWKLDSTSRRILSNKKSLESLKVSIYLAGKVEDSREGLYEAISSIEIAEKKYRFIAQGKAEVKLLKEIENKIYSENPELKL